jgi:hypothetical protein
VRLLLERELGLGRWECERELAARSSGRRGRQQHRPDGVLERAGVRIAIEVELTRKGAARLELILAELSGRYPQVWYFAAADAFALLERLTVDTAWRNIALHRYPPDIGELSL